MLKAFDSIAVLANSSISLSNLRRSNIKHILSKDVHALCDSTHKVSEHLFGDDIEKRLKEVRESKKLSNVATLRSTDQNSQFRHTYGRGTARRGRTETYARHANGRGQNSFLERGNRSQPYYRNQRSSNFKK